MPLRDGSSDEVIEANIAQLIAEGYPREQAIAIAMENAGRSQKTLRWFDSVGGVIKSAPGQHRFNGYLVRYGRADDMDLQKEWFSSQTYFMREAGYPIKGAPVNYQHGMVPTFGNLSIGMFDYVSEDDIGLFVEAQLHTKEQYEAMLKELGRVKQIALGAAQLGRKSELAVKAVDSLIDRVPLSQSMGADIATFRANDSTGHIEQCGIVHGALTPSPADYKNPVVQFKNEFYKAWSYVTTLDHDRTTFVFGHPGPQPIAATTTAVTPIPEVTPKSITAFHAVDGYQSTNNQQETVPMWNLKTMSPEDAGMLRSELAAALEAVFAKLGMDADDGMMAEGVDEMEDKLDARQEELRAESGAENAPADALDEEEERLTEAKVADLVAENLEKILPERVKHLIEQKRATTRKRNASAEKALDGVLKRTPTVPRKGDVGGYRQGEGINKQWAVIGRAEKPNLQSFVKGLITGVTKAQNPYIGDRGGYLIGEEMSTQILDPLRASVVMFDMGVKSTTVSGVGVYTVPKMTTAPTAYRPGINTQLTEGNANYDLISAFLRPIAARVTVPRQLIMQTGKANFEQQLKDQIQKSIQLQIDKEILVGTGSATDTSDTGAQIKGIYQVLNEHSTLTSTNIVGLATNGRKPKFTDLVAAETQINTGNVNLDDSTSGWVMHPRTRGTFRNIVGTDGHPLLFDTYGQKPYNELLGYKVRTTTQIPITDTQGTTTTASKIFVGNFAFAEYVMGDNIEVIVDEMTLADYLQVRIIAYTYSDFIVHYPEAFYVLKGVTS